MMIFRSPAQSMQDHADMWWRLPCSDLLWVHPSCALPRALLQVCLLLCISAVLITPILFKRNLPPWNPYSQLPTSHIALFVGPIETLSRYKRKDLEAQWPVPRVSCQRWERGPSKQKRKSAEDVISLGLQLR